MIRNRLGRNTGPLARAERRLAVWLVAPGWLLILL